METKLQNYKNVINSFIPQSEAMLRAIKGDIIALFYLLSKKLKKNPLDLYRQIDFNSSGAEDFLTHKPPTIPVLIIACNRSGIERTIKQIIKYRPNSELWPLIVSQGCKDDNTKELIFKYKKHIASYVLNVPIIPDNNAKPQFKGYYKISAHFKLALDYAFNNFTIADSVIVVEDDLDIAPDFFEYFSATYRLLKEDSTLYCISAFNDNGRPNIIDQTAYSTLYRTDFFPGLGWMLLRSTWLEVRQEWPQAFWDDYMRSLLVRRSRSCIRPEISRSSTFGQIGVSNGQFFYKYLRTIHLNNVFTNFSNVDMSQLHIDNYDSDWTQQIEEAVTIDRKTLLTLSDMPVKTPLKIIYSHMKEFEEIADTFGLMSDLRDGIARTSYKGVVKFYWKLQPVFLAPAFTA